MPAASALLLVVLLVGISPAWSAPPSQIQRVRFGWHDTFARVVFDLQTKIPYRLLPGPDSRRILVEFSGVHHLPNKSVWHSRNPLIRDVRFSEAATKILGEIRLIHPAAVVRRFRMSTPPRLVIDIAPQVAAADGQHPLPPQTASSLPPVAVSPADADRQSVSHETSSTAANEQPAQPPPPLLSQAQLLQQAEAHWKQGEWAAARQSYRTFLDRFPDYQHTDLIMVRLADISHQQQHLREALEGYAKVIQTYPSSEGALISQIRMAELGIRSPNLLPRIADPHFEPYEHPFQALQQLIRTYPLSPMADIARFKIGEFQLQRNAFPAALEAFRRLSRKSLPPALLQKVRQRLAQTLQRLLMAQLHRGAFVDVLRTFFANRAQLAPRDTRNPGLVVPVVLSYMRLGLFPEAQDVLRSLSQGAPTPKHAPTSLHENPLRRRKNGQPQAIVAQLAPFVSATEPQVQRGILLMLGEQALRAGAPTQAVEYLERARELVSTPGERGRLLTLLAEGYLAQGDPARGQQALQQCTELGSGAKGPPLPETELCLVRLAKLFMDEEQYKLALERYQQLLQAFPATPYRDVTLFHMAEIYQKLGDEAHTMHALEALRDSGTSPLWQKVAADSLDDLTWQKRFHERLAVVQNRLMK